MIQRSWSLYTKLCTKLGTPLCPLCCFSPVCVCVCVCGGGGGGGLRGGVIEGGGFDTIIYSCSLNVENRL